jgi:HlyD family secretion protein
MVRGVEAVESVHRGILPQIHLWRTWVAATQRVVPWLAALALAGCGDAPPPGYSGYVEVEAVRIAAPLAGRLVALNVQRGADVAAGAALFTLEQESEAAAVREARARVERADAAVRDLEKGQRRDELAALSAAVDAQQAALARSDSELKRQRALAAQGFVSGASLTALQAQRDADAAHVRQLQAQLRSARLGGRTDTLDAARAEAQAARAALTQIEWRLQQKAVAAPVAARVDDTLYRVGEWVAAGSPVVTLLEPGAVKLRFFVPETQVARVAPGARVSATCDGCPAPVAATVRYVAREAEFTPPVIYSRGSREKLVFLVEAWPAPADAARLRPGLPVDVTLVGP